MSNIKETKEILDFVFALGNGVARAMEDGEIGFSDLMSFIEPMKKAGPALENAASALTELKNLDAAQLNELVEYSKNRLDLPNDQLEARIELALEAAARLYQVVQAFLSPDPSA